MEKHHTLNGFPRRSVSPCLLTCKQFLRDTFSVVSFLLAATAALKKGKSDFIADYDFGAILANRMILNHVTKNLLAEKFKNFKFFCFLSAFRRERECQPRHL